MIPRVTIVRYDPEGDRLIAIASKRSLSSRDVSEIEERMSDEEIEEWIRETFRRGHLSPWEHTSYTFEIICSRVCSHQLVRHRIASYTQLSQRYNDRLLQPEDSDYWYNLSEKILSGDVESYKRISEIFFIDPDWGLSVRLKIAAEYARSVALYWFLRKNGLSREEARYILPQAIATKIIVTMNAREIVHFLGLRMCTHAQKEIRLVAWALRNELMKIHPRLFKYVGPYCLIDSNMLSREIYSLEELIEREIPLSIERCRELIPREGIRKCVLHSYNLYASYSKNFLST
ncbi:MAG: FAD-dependent thymidylate synthase [Sulfolobales archaeon]